MHSKNIAWQLRVLLRHASELQHEISAHAGIFISKARSGLIEFQSYVRSLNECLKRSDDDSPDDAQFVCALEHVRALRFYHGMLYLVSGRAAQRASLTCPRCTSEGSIGRSQVCSSPWFIRRPVVPTEHRIASTVSAHDARRMLHATRLTPDTLRRIALTMIILAR